MTKLSYPFLSRAIVAVAMVAFIWLVAPGVAMTARLCYDTYHNLRYGDPRDYYRLSIVAYDAVHGKEVRIEDMAELYKFLNRGNAPLRTWLLSHGLKNEEIETIRYGRYKRISD
ncbi:MAG: hypothetical protein ABL917_01320 [Parcubacteria group bacterium]